MKIHVIIGILTIGTPLSKACVTVLIPDLNLQIFARKWEEKVLQIQPKLGSEAAAYAEFCKQHGDHIREALIDERMLERIKSLAANIEMVYQWVIGPRQKKRWK